MPATLAIIGGGLSGTLVVLNLLKQAQKPLGLLWFDKDNAFGQGVAYATPHEYHVLNVRAAGMSLYNEDKDHFVSWLQNQGLPYGSSDFVPRKVFAEYVRHELEALKAANPQVSIRTFAEEVTGLQRSEHGFVINALRTHEAAEVVLALGNFPPAHPRTLQSDYTASPLYFRDPFDSRCLPAALAAASVLIVGSGLTMIDAVLSLYHQGYKGPITAISTHGYLPQPHQAGVQPPIPPYLEPGKHYPLAELLALINRALKQARREGYHPQSVVDQIRPQTQARWSGFTLAEKRQFLRHLRHKWGVARHRAPAESMAVLTKLAESGQLRVLRGRLRGISQQPGGFAVSYTAPGGANATLEAGCIINCTGPESDYGALQSPLVKGLLAAGHIAPDGIRYGIEAGTDGLISAGLYTLGPPLKGVLWESTAIPEIRGQARELALKIIQD